MNLTVFVTLERDSKGKWLMTFSGPKQGGALRPTKPLKAALAALGKVLLKEFPEPKPESRDPFQDLLIPPTIIYDPPDEPEPHAEGPLP